MRMSARVCGSIASCPDQRSVLFLVASLCKAYNGVWRDGLAFGDLVVVVLMRLSSRYKQCQQSGGLDEPRRKSHYGKLTTVVVRSNDSSSTRASPPCPTRKKHTAFVVQHLERERLLTARILPSLPNPLSEARKLHSITFVPFAHSQTIMSVFRDADSTTCT